MALCHEKILAVQCIACEAIGKDGLSSLDPKNASLLQDVVIISFEDEEEDDNHPTFLCYDCIAEIKKWRDFLVRFKSEENVEQVVVQFDSPTDEETPLQNKLPKQHKTPEFLKCELCVFYTNAKTELAAHMGASHDLDDIKTKKDIKCEHCVTNYASPEILSWHREHCHGPHPIVKVTKIKGSRQNAHEYQCIFCDNVFKRHQEVIQHLNRLHDIRNLPFVCNVCGSQFVTSYELKKHQVKCKTKKKKTINKRMPLQHECEQCGLKFVNEEMLMWHTKFCHGVSAVVKIVKVKDRHHQFQCFFCKTRFPNQHLILLHLRGEHKFNNMPFKCNVCDRQFVQMCGLKDHKAKCSTKPKISELSLYYRTFTG